MELSMTVELRESLKAIACEYGLTIVQAAGILDACHKLWLRRAVWPELKDLNDAKLVELMREAAQIYRDGVVNEDLYPLQVFQRYNRPIDWCARIPPMDD